MQELTRAQEEVLRAIWEVEEGAVSDIQNSLSDPKPAYNTVATVIKVLERKGYVSHKTFGKTHVYFPLVSRREYAQNIMKSAAKGLFNGSFTQMASFFVKNKDISLNELEYLRKMLDEEIEKQKSQKNRQP